MIKNQKSILYIGAFELPDKNAAAQRVIANGKILNEIGYSVFYLSFDATLTVNISLAETQSEINGFVVYRTKTPKNIKDSLNYLYNTSNILYLIDCLLPKSLDTIIAYNYPFLALNKLRRICNKRGIKIIADCTEWYDNPTGNIAYKMLKRLDMYYRIQVIQPKLDGVIVISTLLLNFYKKQVKNVLLLPPLIDKEDIKWNRDQDFNLNNAYKLIYAGSPGKGGKDRMDKTINALSIVRNQFNISFHLFIIGLTKKEYINSFGLKNLPDDVDAYTTFKGRMSHLESLKEIKSSDYMIFLRDKILGNMAGFPTKFVEALSCGTPVLTNDSSNILDYLEEGLNGFILDYPDQDKLVKSLNSALSKTKEKNKSMKEYLSNRFSFDYRNYITSFREFMNKIHNFDKDLEIEKR